MTIKELRDYAIKLSGSEKIADEILSKLQAVQANVGTVKEEYDKLCVEEFKANDSSVNRSIVVRYDVVDVIDHDCKAVAFIDNDGSIYFYRLSASYKNLDEYVKETRDDDIDEYVNEDIKQTMENVKETNEDNE